MQDRRKLRSFPFSVITILKICKHFAVFLIYTVFPLETRGEMVYNTGVYA